MTIPLPIVNFQDISVPDPSKVVAAIDWGDGSATAIGTIDLASPPSADFFTYYSGAVSNQPPQGGYDVSGDHTYATQGVYTVTVTISDPAGNSTTVKSTIGTVLLGIGISPGNYATGGFGTTSSVQIANFSGVNSDPSDYVAAIDWGDGSAPTGAEVSPGAFVGTIAVHTTGDYYIVIGTHAYAKPGDYTAKVTVLDLVSGYVGVGDGGGLPATVAVVVKLAWPPSTLPTVTWIV